MSEKVLRNGENPCFWGPEAAQPGTRGLWDGNGCKNDRQRRQMVVDWRAARESKMELPVKMTSGWVQREFRASISPGVVDSFIRCRQSPYETFGA